MPVQPFEASGQHIKVQTRARQDHFRSMSSLQPDLLNLGERNTLRVPPMLVGAAGLRVGPGKFIPDCIVFAASGGLMEPAEMPAHCG